jgi:uncharacterized protein YdeI (YjbR/CyaY-like superfamily)
MVGPSGSDETEPLVVADAATWRAWLDAHEDSSDGVWLVLAKKGVTTPTSLNYAQALDEALCSGWIDGQAKTIDAATYRQRFTPRRKRSLWSARNVANVSRLIDGGRMRPRGFDEIERAKADGRWDAAYAGPATIEIPEDLADVLRRDETTRTTFEALSAQNRYAVLHRITTAHTPETRRRRLDRVVETLSRGESPR